LRAPQPGGPVGCGGGAQVQQGGVGCNVGCYAFPAHVLQQFQGTRRATAAFLCSTPTRHAFSTSACAQNPRIIDKSGHTRRPRNDLRCRTHACMHACVPAECSASSSAIAGPARLLAMPPSKPRGGSRERWHFSSRSSRVLYVMTSGTAPASSRAATTPTTASPPRPSATRDPPCPRGCSNARSTRLSANVSVPTRCCCSCAPPPPGTRCASAINLRHNAFAASSECDPGCVPTRMCTLRSRAAVQVTAFGATPEVHGCV